MVQTKNYLCRKTSLHPNAKMSESMERRGKNGMKYMKRSVLKNQAANPGRQRSAKYATEKGQM